MEYNKKLINETSFVAFDLETTGLFPATAKIIEIGAVKFNLAHEISRFEILVDPETTISRESTEVHGITQEMVKGKQTIGEVLPKFIDFIEGSVLVAHNSIFDVSFICYNLEKLGLDFPDNIVLDTKQIAKNLIPDAPNFKLGTLADYFSLKKTILHRAIYDSEYCMKIFLNLLKHTQDILIIENLLKYNKFLGFDILSSNKKDLNLPEIYIPIKDAIVEKSKLLISYKKVDGEVSNRCVTPINFLKLKNKLYLEAFCHLRGEKRTFKLSKIVEFSKTV